MFVGSPYLFISFEMGLSVIPSDIRHLREIKKNRVVIRIESSKMYIVIVREHGNPIRVSKETI
jgi:bifunctional DNA-binding transcriptional regulator/antitoxin component of YhaV-PrlF toxin-antitoxin module